MKYPGLLMNTIIGKIHQHEDYQMLSIDNLSKNREVCDYARIKFNDFTLLLEIIDVQYVYPIVVFTITVDDDVYTHAFPITSHGDLYIEGLLEKPTCGKAHEVFNRMMVDVYHVNWRDTYIKLG